MRVLHVIDGVGVGGGAEESLVAMLPLLRERGISGSVVCLYPRNGHEEHLRSLGFNVKVLDAKNPWDAVRALRREIVRQRPDLVHASLIDATFASRLACLGLDVPQLNSLVNTTYDPMRAKAVGIKPWKLNTLRLIDRTTSRWVDGFHVLTEAVADEARRELGIPDKKLRLVPRGRSPEQLGPRSAERRARVRRALGIARDTPVILNVGRQAPQKAKLDLVRAMPWVIESVPDSLLLIAGREGPSTEDLRRAVAASPVGDHIRVLGHRSDVPDLLAAADLFVLPSLFEGLGGSLIEAMAMGCPIVGSDAPAVAEVLGWGSYGRVVPRGDVDGFATAMTDLLTDHAEREHYSTAGLMRFSEVFDLGSVVDAMAEVYEELAPSDGTHRPHPIAETAVAAWKKMRRLASVPFTRVTLFGFVPKNSVAIASCGELLHVTDAAEFARIRAARPELSTFGTSRLHRGNEFWALTRSGEILSSLWTSGQGAPAYMLEIARTVPLAGNQRVFFDLQTPPEHRGQGFAVELMTKVATTLAPTQLLSWVVTNNTPSIRVNEKSGGIRLGTYSMWSPTLRRVSERLAGLESSATPLVEESPHA